LDVAHMLDEAPLETADQCVGLTTSNRKGSDHGGVGAHDGSSRIRGDALAAYEGMELGDVVPVAGIVFRIDDLAVLASSDGQAEAFEASFDHGRAADQYRLADAIFENDLGSPEDPLILAVGKGD